MADYNNSREQWKEERRRRREERREQFRQFGIVQGSGDHNPMWTGLLILLIGVVALLRATVEGFPTWVFSWQSLLILLGLIIGVKHHFRGAAWFVLILVGGVFLVNDIYPVLTFRYLWPLILIVIGLFLILRPRHRFGNFGDDVKKNDVTGTPGPGPESEKVTRENFVDSVCIFSGNKKNIFSKDFKGADIVNIFGGTELNLTQADIHGRVPVEFTTIFGGAKLIIPSNWAVQSEAVTIFGGLEDKRSVSQGPENSEKTLVLKGTIIFGGIEIKSF